MLAFNFDTYMSDISRRIEVLFDITDLNDRGWNFQFHYDNHLIPCCDYPVFASIEFFNNCTDEEWDSTDEGIINSFRFNLGK